MEVGEQVGHVQTLDLADCDGDLGHGGHVGDIQMVGKVKAQQESQASWERAAPAKCPRCNSTSEKEAEDRCTPTEGECPMTESPFLNRWPSQSEFDGYQKIQEQLADAMASEPSPSPEWRERAAPPKFAELIAEMRSEVKSKTLPIVHDAATAHWADRLEEIVKHSEEWRELAAREIAEAEHIAFHAYMSGKGDAFIGAARILAILNRELGEK